MFVPTTTTAPVVETGFQVFSLPQHPGGIGRREIVPPNEVGAFPYGSICKIWSESVQGTGFLIEGNRILTAGHVLRSALSRGVYFSGHEPFRVTKPQIWVHPRHQVEGDLFDYGVITVHPQLVVTIPAIPIVAATTDVLRRVVCEIVGYAQDFVDMVRYPKHGANPVDPRLEIRVANGVLQHRFDTSQGESGAPILARAPQNPNQWFAIGIHTFGEGNQVPGWPNRGVAFPPNMILDGIT
jgi:V8-like Glu-specific endopeptidase